MLLIDDSVFILLITVARLPRIVRFRAKKLPQKVGYGTRGDPRPGLEANWQNVEVELVIVVCECVMLRKMCLNAGVDWLSGVLFE